jgi:hypothetical protein
VKQSAYIQEIASLSGRQASVVPPANDTKEGF